MRRHVGQPSWRARDGALAHEQATLTCILPERREAREENANVKPRKASTGYVNKPALDQMDRMAWSEMVGDFAIPAPTNLDLPQMP